MIENNWLERRLEVGTLIREDIQDYIVEKLNIGWTLRETVEGIEENFGVRMSKQNVNKFYNRLNERNMKRIREMPNAKLCGEVFIRRQYMNECMKNEMLLEKFTAYKIKRLITDHSYYIQGLADELANKVADLYILGYSVEDISSETAYTSEDGKYTIETSEEVIQKILAENIKEPNLF